MLEILENLNGVVNVVIAVALCGLIGICIKFAQTKTNVIKDAEKQSKINTLLERLGEAAKVAVNGSRDVITENVRAGLLNDGKIDKSEFDKIKDELVDRVLKGLGTETVDIINEGVGVIGEYVADLVGSRMQDVVDKIYVEESTTPLILMDGCTDDTPERPIKVGVDYPDENPEQ